LRGERDHFLSEKRKIIFTLPAVLNVTLQLDFEKTVRFCGKKPDLAGKGKIWRKNSRFGRKIRDLACKSESASLVKILEE